MATIRDYYQTDFRSSGRIGGAVQYSLSNSQQFEVEVNLHYAFESYAKFISCFIPECLNPESYIPDILNRTELILDYAKQRSVSIIAPLEKNATNARDCVFTGIFYVYTGTDLTENLFEELREYASSKGLILKVRGPSYAMECSKLQKPLAFISHDSRDKGQVASKIAQGLSSLSCPVWYDEYSLKIGDRLRESIEKGLKECKKCILVLSPNFFNNEGWTKTEFDSIFTRELIENQDCILPVWYNVTKEQVYNYSPSLANRLGARWELGAEEVIRQLHQAIL